MLILNITLIQQTGYITQWVNISPRDSFRKRHTKNLKKSLQNLLTSYCHVWA